MATSNSASTIRPRQGASTPKQQEGDMPQPGNLLEIGAGETLVSFACDLKTMPPSIYS